MVLLSFFFSALAFQSCSRSSGLWDKGGNHIWCSCIINSAFMLITISYFLVFGTAWSQPSHQIYTHHSTKPYSTPQISPDPSRFCCSSDMFLFLFLSNGFLSYTPFQTHSLKLPVHCEITERNKLIWSKFSLQSLKRSLSDVLLV